MTIDYFRFMRERRPTLVLTGATGFIGKQIAAYFAARNWHVIALVRYSPEQHIPNVLYYDHNFASLETLVLPDDVDAFIHAAYVKENPGYDAFEVNVAGAKKLLAAMAEKNVKQSVFFSSLSADENALSVYGRQKAAIEKLFLEAGGTVIRAGLVLGDGGLFGAMREYLGRRALIPLFGDGQQPVQTVHIGDLAEATWKIVAGNHHGTFVIATDTPVPYREFYRSLAESAGTKPKFIRLPFWLASFVIRAAKTFGIKVPVDKDNLLGLRAMKRTPSADDLKKLGLALRDHNASFSALQAPPRQKIS